MNEENSPLVESTEAQTQGGGNMAQNGLHKKNIITIGILFVAILIISSVAYFFGGTSFLTPKSNYASVYTLVNDKISQHGAIVVNLPKGVSKENIEAKVSFEPVIKGEWVRSDIADAVVYKPTDELALGKYYLVSLATDNGTIKKDFQVDEDPRIISIFPDEKAEAELASAITIIFNRPMVPLTTLSQLDEKKIPVTITPATSGKFKWISTRTLQFIPSGTLYGSTHYTVAINSGFVSMDGLAVPGKEYSFVTKQLRLTSATSGQIAYNQPLNFYFNQPVDLDKTSKGISLTNNTTHEKIEFVASYGKALVWDDKSATRKEIEDRSIIRIVPKNSLYGHLDVWDFLTSYTASIENAYPVGGDIAIAGTLSAPAITTSITASSVLKDYAVQSDKTKLAASELFDPAGTVSLSFYEDIDTAKSVIKAKGLKNVTYGEKCKETNDNSYSYGDCMKVSDRSQVILSFDPSVYSRGEKVSVFFDKLVNDGGYQINSESVFVDLVVYPELKITKSIPSSGHESASLQEIILCSNVPLKEKDAKGFYQSFRANKYMVFGRWDYPYLQKKYTYESNPPCAADEYVNRIHYGVLPLEQYTLAISADDVFGQSAALSLSFKTGKAPKFYLRFQNLQKVYSVTTPEHTKLTYATENFDYVNALVCKVSPDSMVRALAHQPGEVSTTPDSSLPCADSVTKKIALKSDQWVNQYFQIDIKDYFEDPRGQYIVSFSHPNYRNGEGSALYARTYLSVTNLAVTDNRVKWTSYDRTPDVPRLTPSDTRGSVYWLSNIHTLLPEVGAKVSVYQTTERYNTNAPLSFVQSEVTDDKGFVEFPLIADVAGAAITSGDESAVVSQWSDTLSNGSWRDANEAEETYVYTDRPIYRPGQEVFLKGLYRLGFDGKFEIFRDNDIQVKISDSKGNTVLDQKVPVTAYGTFSTSVKLPLDAPLGTYFISSRNGYAQFDVEEYAAAAFEAKAETDKDEYLAGGTANISMQGKYYFGVPVDGGSVDYTVTSQDYYFDRYTDEYFNFGGGWYDCYDCGYGDTYLKNGKAMLDANGLVKIELPLNFTELYKDKERDRSKILVVHGRIKDKQGKSVSFQKSFIVHRGDYYVGIKADPLFVGVKQSFTLRAKTVDVQGKATSRSGIVATINKVEWKSYKRQEVDGGYYNRPERTLTPVATKKISTNSSGDYTDEISLNDAGEYEISVEGKDEHGNVVKSTGMVYVYGAGNVEVRATNNATLDLVTEKSDVKVGETAKFLIKNPYPHAKALISIQRGHIFSYEVVDINQNLYEYQFQITEDHIPNVYASVVLLSPLPEVKFGQIEFTVNKKQKELVIDTTFNKNSYLPGETVKLTVKTHDSEGRPVPASVSVAVADVSVLALKGNVKKNPLIFFYDGLPLTVTTETNIKNLLTETPIPTGTKGGDGGEGLANRKRGEFRDTAFWQAEVETGADGVAELSFTLPDNLTKWQVESIGITKDTKVGVRYREVVTQKEVMTIPLAPRFVVPGDEFMIGAKIFNQTANAQTLAISIESSTLEIKDAAKTQKTIKAGETETVYFNVKAPQDKNEGAHTFVLSAKNSDYNDTVEQTIAINRGMTYESTATAGSTVATSTREYLYLPGNVIADRGGLTVKTSATLANYLSDAIKYLFAYPYGCSEQLASKLSAIVIAKKATELPGIESQTLPKITFDRKDYTVDQAVDIGLSRIYDNQTIEGGFSYYKGLRPSPHLTLQVLNTLIDVKNAGYPVRQNVINSTVQYLRGQVAYFKNPLDVDTLIILSYTLSRVDGRSTLDVSSYLTPAYLSDVASSNTLGYLALLAVNGGVSPLLKEKIFATISNRMDIDSRGAYIKTNQKNLGWMYYETPEKDTALFLKALVADKREHKETDNIIRWLVASRARDGSWGSTNTSVAVLDALSNYLSWKRETESSFTLATLLDEETISTATFEKGNILSIIETFLPVTKIERNKTHTVTFQKANKNDLPNKFYYDLSLKYYLPVEQIAPRDEGISVTREFFDLTDKEDARPLATTKVGNVIRGVLTMVVPKERHLLSVEDYIPAGFELVNFDLATEDKATSIGDLGYQPSVSQGTTIASVPVSVNTRNFLASIFSSFGNNSASVDTVKSKIAYQRFYPDFKELHDDRLFLFAQEVPPGTYTYEYYLRATTPGTFKHLPAVASEMYFPENFGRTAGSVFTVEQ